MSEPAVTSIAADNEGGLLLIRLLRHVYFHQDNVWPSSALKKIKEVCAASVNINVACSVDLFRHVLQSIIQFH